MAGVGGLLRRWRCWWRRPLGHVDEMIEYVDRLSGRWAARIRCARCGREGGLAVGHRPRRGAIFPGNPLATMLSRQGARQLPAKSLGIGPPSARPGWIDVETPDGELISVRRVHARLAFGRERDVYLAGRVASDDFPTIAFDLRRALAGEAPDAAGGRWLERAVAQLEPELRSAS